MLIQNYEKLTSSINNIQTSYAWLYNYLDVMVRTHGIPLIGSLTKARRKNQVRLEIDEYMEKLRRGATREELELSAITCIITLVVQSWSTPCCTCFRIVWIQIPRLYTQMSWRKYSTIRKTSSSSLGTPSHVTKLGINMWPISTKWRLSSSSFPKLQNHSVLSC